MNLTVAIGEIVGVAGVAGNGQRELGDLILGVTPLTAGAKLLDGRDATRWSVAKIRAHGVAFVPEDALAMAAFGSLTIVENFALGGARELASGKLQPFQGPLKDNRGVERVKAGDAFPLTDLRKMDWLVEGVVGQPK